MTLQQALMIGSATLFGLASAQCTKLVEVCNPLYPQLTCEALGLGCQFTNNVCSSTIDCAAYTSMATCNAMAATGACTWSDPNACDVTDITACASTTSPYYTCLINGATNGNMDICNCLPKYFSCISMGQCAALPGLLDSCAATVSVIDATCDPTWCNFGTTRAVSTFVLDLSFSVPSSSWDSAKIAEFEAAVEAWLPIDGSWSSFDAAIGQLTITVPAGTSISSSQLNSIAPSLAAISTQPDAEANFAVTDVTVVEASTSPVDSDLGSAVTTGVGAAALLASVSFLF